MKPVPRRLAPGAAALAAGLAAAFAHPPFGFLPGLLGFGALMLLAERARGLHAAFWRGWLFGTAYFLVGCWWVNEAFQVDAETYGWLGPLAVAGMAGGLGAVWGAATLAYRAMRPAGAPRVVLFAGVLALFEWIRGHALTGFPWNLIGETWEAGGVLSQSAALFGVYGLTWLTVFIASAPALLVVNRRSVSTWIAVGTAGLTLCGLTAYGWIRTASPAPDGGLAIAVRLVQPNFVELASYDPQVAEQRLAAYLRMTAAPSRLETAPAMVFWPEGALPWPLDDVFAPGLTRTQIAEALREGQMLAIAGWRRAPGPGKVRNFNSLMVVRKTGGDLQVLAVYDKHRLVPFGEYTPGPLRAVGFGTLVPVPESFEIGPPPAPVSAGALILQPLICYESLFPGFTRRGALRSGERPHLIVNLSNDGWFGLTSGPLQHLNLARYRSIEEGLTMVRSTPAGVSAIVDPFGRIAEGERLGLAEAGVVDAIVNTVQVSTAYRRYGDLAFWLMIGLSLLAFGAIRMARRPAA